jgi:hypothetical protein
MATFWKGFAIFWIIFLIWYLTGGPQRVNTSNNFPTTIYNGIGEVATTTQDNTDSASAFSFSASSPSTDNSSNPQTQTNPSKSFSNQPKTNTINVNN